MKLFTEYDAVKCIYGNLPKAHNMIHAVQAKFTSHMSALMNKETKACDCT